MCETHRIGGRIYELQRAQCKRAKPWAELEADVEAGCTPELHSASDHHWHVPAEVTTRKRR